MLGGMRLHPDSDGQDSMHACSLGVHLLGRSMDMLRESTDLDGCGWTSSQTN